MSVALLDVNVLLALLQSNHEFHSLVRTWFSEHRSRGWATCTLTQAGFVRLAAQTMVGFDTVPGAFVSLQSLCARPEHHFWPLDYSLTEIRHEIRTRIRGHKQLTDAILLDLAIRKGGKLVTMDKRVHMLLPADSPHQASLEVMK